MAEFLLVFVILALVAFNYVWRERHKLLRVVSFLGAVPIIIG